jgi:hypothetical protein
LLIIYYYGHIIIDVIGGNTMYKTTNQCCYLQYCTMRPQITQRWCIVNYCELVQTTSYIGS